MIQRDHRDGNIPLLAHARRGYGRDERSLLRLIARVREDLLDAGEDGRHG